MKRKKFPSDLLKSRAYWKVSPHILVSLPMSVNLIKKNLSQVRGAQRLVSSAIQIQTS